MVGSTIVFFNYFSWKLRLNIIYAPDIYLQEDFGNISLLSILEEKGFTTEVYDLFRESLRQLARKNGEPEQISGKQEYFENLINKFI